MHEFVANFHMHTRYSDGHGSYSDIARAAMSAGLDIVIVTDHNVWVNGPERYYESGSKRVLLLVGEEIHDTGRDPQKNHLLVFGAEKELAAFAYRPQELIHSVRDAGGLSFLAHPFDLANKQLKESDIAWEAWEVGDYTGIELWNGLSELKAVMTNLPAVLFYALNPRWVPHAPPQAMLEKWDELLRQGRRVVAIGGSDAHQLPGRMGPVRRTIFPYEIHFRSINTHLLLPKPLTGSEDQDKALVYDALREGHAFVGNDLPAPARGFRFSGQSPDGDFLMGDEVRLGSGVTLQIRLPHRAECILLKDGRPYKTWAEREAMVIFITEPGVYRVEVYCRFLGKRRGWIFSNPVYVRAG